MFPEIKDIKFKFRSFNNYLLVIKKEIPVFFVNQNSKKIFYSSEGKKFWIYNLPQFDLNNIIELSLEKPIDTNFLVDLYKYLFNIQKINSVKKIYFKYNNEIVIETISENKIVVDKELLEIDPKLFSKTFEIAEEENVDIYARDLISGKIYVKKQH
jgi:hypothetical protein